MVMDTVEKNETGKRRQMVSAAPAWCAVWGKTEGRKRRSQRMRQLDGITDTMDMNLGKFREMVRDRETWCVAVHGVSKSQRQLGD